MHQGGFNRFCYDITDLLTLGKKNTLEVKVAKESANSSINAAERKADWWLYGGIYRRYGWKLFHRYTLNTLYLMPTSMANFKLHVKCMAMRKDMNFTYRYEA